MGIKDKLFGDAQQIVDRANKKISKLEGVTSRFLLPGFKQIEKDLKDLGALGFVEFSFNHGSFMIDSGNDYVYFNCWFENARADKDGAFIEGVFVHFDTYIQYAQKITLPSPSGSIEPDGWNIIRLNSSNIGDFEKYMDDLMSYITRNSQLIIDTIEDATVYVLKESGNIVSY